jgi:hypothetical protein
LGKNEANTFDEKALSSMNRILAIFAILLAVIAEPNPASAAIINDLLGPSDYGATVMPTDYSIANAVPGNTRQGVLLNDCFIAATMASIEHQQPSYFARDYQIQSDGNVIVTLGGNGYLVTPLVNWFWGDATTGYDGANGNGADAIILKAYAAFRNPSNTMADLNFGFPSEPIAAFGLTSVGIPDNVASITAAFNAGYIVEIDTGFVTPPNGVAGHTYSVWGINPDRTLLLRSPWGDGYDYRGISEFLNADDAWLETYADGAFGGKFGGAAPLGVPEPSSIALIATISVAMASRRYRRVA